MCLKVRRGRRLGPGLGLPPVGPGAGHQLAHLPHVPQGEEGEAARGRGWGCHQWGQEQGTNSRTCPMCLKVRRGRTTRAGAGAYFITESFCM